MFSKRKGERSAVAAKPSRKRAGFLSRLSEETPIAPATDAPKMVQPDNVGPSPVDDLPSTATERTSLKTAKAKKAAAESPYDGRIRDPVEMLGRLHADFDGFAWADWELEALWDAVAAKFGQPPSAAVKDMIGALGVLLHSESFWHEAHIFLWTCQALCGKSVDFRQIPELEPWEVIYGAKVARHVREERDSELPNGKKVPGVHFAPEILATVAAVFRMAGMVYVPFPLEGATSHLVEGLDDSAKELSAEVKARWKEVRKDPSKADDTEGALRVQLDRLSEVRAMTKRIGR